MAEPRLLQEFKDTWDGHIKRNRTAIIDGYWQTGKYRLDHTEKNSDFKHTQTSAEELLEALSVLLHSVNDLRDKPGVQPYINNVVKAIEIHLDRIKEYYGVNEPTGYNKKEHQKEEVKFQRFIFKGEKDIKSKLRNLNIENDMSHLEIKFFDNIVATLPMMPVLMERDHKIKAKIESIDVDWDMVIDNGLIINMQPKDIPDYNPDKHFWDQDKESLQFWVSEWNKIKNGITIDGYEMSPSLYFQVNYFKTPIKDHGNKIMNPPFRDNEWYMDEIKKNAKKKAVALEPAGIMIFGTRRYAKTSLEAQHAHHGLLVYPTQTGTITSSSAEDLASIIDKIQKSLDNIHPAFKVNIYSGTGWEKEVFFGIKSGSGRVTYQLFKFSITNTEAGNKKGTQKTAGGNPIIFVADEVAKAPFILSYEAAIPSFESSDGWVCQPIYTGTPGNEDLSADAEKVLADPEGFNFIHIDWDILEHGIPKEHITWIRRKFCWFIPAQMSIMTGNRKIKTNFADFLGVDSEQLSKIEFWVTDWKHNKENILKQRAKLKGEQLQQFTVFRPIDPEECFMSAKNNPFPAHGIKKHKERLQAEGDQVYGLARRVELYKEDGKVKVRNSSKEVNKFPHNGKYTDCPFLLYDDFPETPPYDKFRYVGGHDDYKQDQSDGDSIGAFYIFDRLKRKIVLSLANRPDPHGEMHKQIHMALDAYNAKSFMENEDMDFKKYLDRVSNPSFYLYKGFDAYGDFSKFSNGTRKFGWKPDKNTAPQIRGYSVEYTKEDLEQESEGESDITYGFERIEDVQLLEEMIKYKDGGNYDRLVAFGSCLAMDYYLSSNYITPKTGSQKSVREEAEREQSNSIDKNKFFTKTRRSTFSRKQSW